jgi:hypothetical protein
MELVWVEGRLGGGQVKEGKARQGFGITPPTD